MEEVFDKTLEKSGIRKDKELELIQGFLVQ